MTVKRALGIDAVDIGVLLDTGAWSTIQKIAVLLAAMTVLIDGFDSQLIGFAIPVIIKEWGVTRGDFAPVVAAALVGMSIGSLGSGFIADRFGRRSAMIGSVLLFGAATCAIAASQNLMTIGVLRFVAGLGIGGAIPASTTMTAEVTPARARTMAVTATIVCVPLGGVVAGLFAAAILPNFGWRTLFLIGGIVPIGLAALLWAVLPESPRFLARDARRWPALTALLARMARPLPPGTSFLDSADNSGEPQEGFMALFSPTRRRDTILLWVSLFLCLLTVYSAFNWLPTMLAAQGLSVAMAGTGLTAYNLGGVFGALVCSGFASRYGSRWPLVLCAIGAAASAIMLEYMNLGNILVLVFGFGLHGLFVNAVQSTLYAVLAYAYPTSIRGKGTASAIAFGRIGGISSAFIAAAVISTTGPTRFLNVLAMSMLGVALFLVFLQRHIPRHGGAPARQPV